MTRCLVVAALAFVGWGQLATPAMAIDQDLIDRSIQHGVANLKRQQTSEGFWIYSDKNGENTGATALAALTLMECGVSADDPKIKKAIEVIRERSIESTQTYTISLAIMFLDRLGDPRDISLIESLMVRLLAGQTKIGGWTYDCPSIGAAEVRRLRGGLYGLDESQRKKRDPDDRPTFRDLPKEIQDQLTFVQNAQPFGVDRTDCDNSNTQFATFALWIGRKHGLPVTRALARVDARFRQSQNAEGGWGYNLQTANFRAQSPAMTCAGLLGLAAAYGAGLESQMRINKGEEGKAGKEGTPIPRHPREPNRDPAVRGGLLYLGALLAQAGRAPALELKQRKPPDLNLPFINGPIPVAEARGGRGTLDDYYFLWSLERVGMVYGLKTIGNRDWYAWGSEWIMSRQQPDGGWANSYGQGGVDTCFALLFLSRSNLAGDLTSALKGKVVDPGEVKLKSGGVGGESLKGNAAEKAAKQGAPDKTPKLELPKGTAASSEADRLSREIVNAPADKREGMLDKLRDGRGPAFTEALAQAIPQLYGGQKTKARDALAERLSRMTPPTLKDKLQDPDAEVRRAAALACALKEAKALIPDVIPLIEDQDSGVARAAYVVLKELTGRDFGPKPDAEKAERRKAATDWKAWWSSQKNP